MVSRRMREVGEVWPGGKKKCVALDVEPCRCKCLFSPPGWGVTVKLQSSFCLPCFVCIPTLPKKKKKRVFFMGIIQFLLSVGLKGVPVPGLLISRGLQLGPALISCNYKRIPVVTQSYSRLKELTVQRNAGTASESHRTQFAHVWSVYLTKKFHFNSVWLIWLAIATRIKSFFQHFSPDERKTNRPTLGSYPLFNLAFIGRV